LEIIGKNLLLLDSIGLRRLFIIGTQNAIMILQGMHWGYLDGK